MSPGKGADRRRRVREHATVLAAVAAGGGLGGLARLGVDTALGGGAGGIPWATLLVNVTGAFALGALMVLASGLWPTSRHLRPFAGVGVLGGYTTFSAYMLETADLVMRGEAPIAAAYLFGTLVTGTLAVGAGMLAGRVVVRRAGGPGRARTAAS